MTSEVYFCPPGWSDVPCTGHPSTVPMPPGAASTETGAAVGPGTEAGRRLLVVMADHVPPTRLEVAAVLAIEAEARQQGRDHGLREALRETTDMLHVLGWHDQHGWKAETCPIERCRQNRDLCRALASADGPPEPGIDVERLDRALATAGIHVDASRLDRTLPGPEFNRPVACPSCAAGVVALAAEYARLSADGDSPGGAE